MSKIASDPFDAANAAIAHGDVSVAVTMLRTALAGRPAKPLAWHTLGELLRKRGELADAIDCFVRATELRPLRDRFAASLCDALRVAGRLEESRLEAERFMTLVRAGHTACAPDRKRIIDACTSGSPK
jgi:cytochrome c-type biogenesis protein CcmH/NrfG